MKGLSPEKSSVSQNRGENSKREKVTGTNKDSIMKKGMSRRGKQPRQQ